MKYLMSVAFGFSLALCSECFSAEIYLSAKIGDDKNLHIATNDGKDIMIKRKDIKGDGEQFIQLGFEGIKISTDHLSVGWLSTFENCCGSDPIPLRLDVYSGGQSHSFRGNGLPIWQWTFDALSQKVSYRQEPVHGGIGVLYEMREIKTGKLVDSFDPEKFRGKKTPAWVKALD